MEKSWGYHLRLDASGLNPDTIRSESACKKFLSAICEHIGMTAFGDPIVVRFGKDPKVSGFSLVQLIEESTISAHLVEQDNSGYFDVFSCLPFDHSMAVKFIVEYFDVQAHKSDYTERQAPGISNYDKYEDPRASD